MIALDQSLWEDEKKKKIVSTSIFNIIEKSWCHHHPEKSIHRFHNVTRIIEELQPFCSRVKVITRSFATLTVNRGKQKEQSLRNSLDTFFRHGKHFLACIEKIRHSRYYSLVYFPFTHFIRVYIHIHTYIHTYLRIHAYNLGEIDTLDDRSFIPLQRTLNGINKILAGVPIRSGTHICPHNLSRTTCVYKARTKCVHTHTRESRWTVKNRYLNEKPDSRFYLAR